MTWFPFETQPLSTTQQADAAAGYAAVIGYTNYGFSFPTYGVTVTTDSEASGFSAQNLFNWKPYNAWKPAATGSHYVQCVLGASAFVDYFACAQWIAADSASSIVLQYSNNAGSTWTNAHTRANVVGRLEAAG